MRDQLMDEMNRQCAMAWGRGRDIGLLYGVVGTLLAALLIKIAF